MTFFELACYSRSIRHMEERAWWHTASLLSMQANLNRDPKKNANGYTPKDFHPYADDKLDAGKAKFVRGLSEEDKDLHREWAEKIRLKHGTTGK